MDTSSLRSTYLVTAIGSLSAPAVIAGLRGIPGARVLGGDSNPARWLANSALVDGFHRLPCARDPAGFIDALLRLCRGHGITDIVPLTDPEVDVLDAHRDVVAATGARMLMPDAETVRVCRDKWHLFQAFQSDPVVATIPTWLPVVDVQVPQALPLLAKPRAGRSSEGLLRIHDHADYRHAQSLMRGRDYIMQPLLHGEVCVVDVVRQASTGHCATMARQELLRTCNGAGTSVRMLPTGTLDRQARHVAERLRLNGCINLEFLQDGDRYLLMDANPRFSAGVGFSVIAGYDMVGNHLRCFDGASLDPQVAPGVEFCTRRQEEVAMPMAGGEQR